MFISFIYSVITCISVFKKDYKSQDQDQFLPLYDVPLNLKAIEMRRSPSSSQKTLIQSQTITETFLLQKVSEPLVQCSWACFRRS